MNKFWNAVLETMVKEAGGQEKFDRALVQILKEADHIRRDPDPEGRSTFFPNARKRFTELTGVDLDNSYRADMFDELLLQKAQEGDE